MKKLILFLITILTLNLYPQQYGWKVLSNAQMILTSITFVDTMVGFCSGNHKIYKTTDGGSTWKGVNIDNNAWSISFANKSVGYSCGNYGDGYIHKTTDGGNNWTRLKRVWNENYYSSSTLSSNHNITVGDTGYWIASLKAKSLMTTDVGNTWKEELYKDSASGYRKVFFTDSLHGWIKLLTDLNRNGEIILLRTSDGGNNWVKAGVPEYNLQVFTFIDSLRGWAANSGMPSPFYKTTNGGDTWELTYTDYNFHCDFYPGNISFADSLNGWAFGQTTKNGYFQGIILHTSNGGYKWEIEALGAFSPLTDGMMVDKYHGWACDEDGRILAYTRLTDIADSETEKPKGYYLYNNYPNPFNPSTAIEYEVPVSCRVIIKIFDVQGKEVKVLMNEEKKPGRYKIEFNADKLPNGIYFSKMEAGDFKQTIKMNLLK